MKRIVSINNYKVDRERYEFITKAVLIKDEEGKDRLFFTILLKDKETQNIVNETGLERYICDLSYANVISESTYRIATSRVVKLLNYILHNTKINMINELTVNEIRGFLNYAKTKSNGQMMKSDSWNKTISDVFLFLTNYYKYNHETVRFGYTAEELRETVVIKEKGDVRLSRKIVISKNKTLHVKPPKENDHKHRNRAIMYGHLNAIRYAARKYDPMIHLAICLQAYGGLREGEVVNLSFSDISIYKRIGVTEKISLNLTKSDQFRKGKSHTGVIKKLRRQEIYPDFLEDTEKALNDHKKYLEAKGLPTEGNNPVFYNKYKKAMSVTTYSGRLKELFNNHFLRILKYSSEITEFEGETYAYIGSYEDEYPGAHMFRHWFTMYLITKKHLRPEEVRKWRGDSPHSNAYEEYLHTNYDLIEAYRDTAYSFQESLLEDIYE